MRWEAKYVKRRHPIQPYKNFTSVTVIILVDLLVQKRKRPYVIYHYLEYQNFAQTIILFPFTKP